MVVCGSTSTHISKQTFSNRMAETDNSLVLITNHDKLKTCIKKTEARCSYQICHDPENQRLKKVNSDESSSANIVLVPEPCKQKLSPRDMSPKKSPGCLARQRLLRKYQRPHVASPTSRKLFLNPLNGSSDKQVNIRKPAFKSQDPKMPRLTEISVLLERIDHENNNTFPLNQVTSKSLKRKSQSENNVLPKRTNSSESDIIMPHLHRVSSEEKTIDSVDGHSDLSVSDNENLAPVKVEKQESFKQRESLFEILEHEKEKYSPPQNNNPVIHDNWVCSLPKSPNGIYLKKYKLTEVKKKLSISQNRIERPGLFTVGSQLTGESEGKTSDTNSLKGEPDNKNDIVDLLPISDDLVDGRKSPIFQPVSTPRYHCCYSDQPLNGSVINPSMGMKAKAQNEENLMCDLSELKHEREDQTEFYPDSVSSLEDHLDMATNSPQTMNTQSISQLDLYRSVPIKPLSTMSSPVINNPKPTRARERRQRPKILSSRCTCCMDVGSGRKRKKRKKQFSSPLSKSDWSIPQEYSQEQQVFVNTWLYLIKLRQKIFHLFQVLFPKLRTMWHVNTDTDQVDCLVEEITTEILSMQQIQPKAALMEASSHRGDNPIPGDAPCLLTDAVPGCDKGQPLSDSVSDSAKDVEPLVDAVPGCEESCLLPDPLSNCGEGPVDEAEGNCDNVEDQGNLADVAMKNLDKLDPTSLLSQNDFDVTAVRIDTPPCEPLTSTSSHSSFEHLEKDLSCEPLAEVTCDIPNTGVCTESSQETGNTAESKSSSSLPKLWGSASNNRWELEFCNYLSKSSSFSKPLPNVTPVGQDVSSNSALPNTCTSQPDSVVLVDVKVEACKEPQLCLTSLRHKVLRLLQTLLPGLTLENNFDKFSEDVDLLVDLVTQRNEQKWI